MNLLLKLLGVRAPEAVGVSDFTLAFRGSVQGLWVAALVLLSGALAWWLYRRSPQVISASRRRLLAALRIAFLALLALILLKPVLAFTVEGSVRRLLVLLVDDSLSMRIRDPRTELDSRKRAAIALGTLHPTNGLRQSLPENAAAPLEAPSRVELVKAALANPRLNLLAQLEQEYDLVPFAFGQSLGELPRETAAAKAKAAPDAAEALRRHSWVQRLDPQSPLTALGDALRTVLSRQRGQPLAGIFLVTDGANNSGGSPRESAALLRQDAVPLYTWGVGLTSPRDLIVASLFAPDVAFVKEEASAVVRVRAQGFTGRKAALKLLLDGKLAAERELVFAADGEQTLTLSFVPGTPGDFELKASIEPLADETVKDNNSRSQRLKAIDTRIKTLMVEQSPRWEFRYLQAMLLRDRRIDLKCVLLEGDPNLARGTNSPYLERFPQRKDELFKYDLVILGDADPRRLTVQNQENLNEWVSRFGGALIVVAGKRHMPSGYRRSTLERMLPVELEAGLAEPAGDPVGDKPIRLELTASGRANPMLRLSDREEESAAIWKDLPPVYWVARVARPKPAAEVLLVDADPARETRAGKMPVVAFQHYGLGQVMFVGTDNTWRWRRNVGEAHYTALWGQMMQRLTIQRLMGGSKRTQLAADRQNYATGERVAIYARLYSPAYEPVQDPSVQGVFGLRLGETGRRTPVTLRAIPEQPGLYRGELVAPAPGQYQFFVEQDPETPLDFNVTEPAFEFSEPGMNDGLLTELARTSGGAFLREEDLHRLPGLIAAKAERVKSPQEVELWCSPLYFLLLLALVSAEWILRKRSQLR